MTGTADDSQGWDAFGSDEEETEDDDNNRAVQSVVSRVSQVFVKANVQVRMSERVVWVEDDSNVIASALAQRGMTVHRNTPPNDESLKDAVVDIRGDIMISRLSTLLPGGLLISADRSLYDDNFFHEPEIIHKSDALVLWAGLKRRIRIHSSKCPWLPPSHSCQEEEKLLLESTICLSAHECGSGQLTNLSILQAVRCLRENGYCVIRSLLDPDECEKWGRAVLESVHSAARILLDRDQVDIYHPHTSKFEPQAYRELSMREDLRLDLRSGPELALLRRNSDRGNESVIVSSQVLAFDGFLRGNSALLEIIRRAMNPKRDNLFQGNIGRFNFGGSGPDGSFQDLRVSPVGGIVTFGGCADQAIHADTPHLFENIPDLPPHYVNVFAPGTAFDDGVGGTAFVHGSHNLEFTAKHYRSDKGFTSLYPYLVRPCLNLGDVLIFDCRILHFGMSNTSDSVERVLLYTNTTQAWFHDPKNWDERRPIFQNFAVD